MEIVIFSILRVVIGYLTAVHSFLEKEKERVHPGTEHVSRRKATL